MREIVFFSNNQNKINEISNLFLKFNLKLLTLNDFENIISPEEIGKSFKDNAKIKSVYGLKNFSPRVCCQLTTPVFQILGSAVLKLPKFFQ